uniref:Uncharacterized protein n=1 Tax=Opuntia streptacantha TaxID=393608 RepID=A0A7C9A2B5_OPUST
MLLRSQLPGFTIGMSINVDNDKLRALLHETNHCPILGGTSPCFAFWVQLMPWSMYFISLSDQNIYCLVFWVVVSLTICPQILVHQKHCCGIFRLSLFFHAL